MADDPKLAEFRENNIKLTKQNEDLTKQVTDLQAQLAANDGKELATAKTTLATRDTELAAERAAHAETRKKAEASVINQKIEDAFLRTGGRPEARAFVVAQAAGQFTVDEHGELKGTQRSPDRPGEPMSVSEWMLLQTKSNSFCFHPSGGAGSRSSAGMSGTSNVKVLRNPTPQELGKHASDIAKGLVKLEYD